MIMQYALANTLTQICLFYVVLRALDTIEDDMTIPDDVKQPMLRSFHQKVITPGWHFTGSGPNEKDRDVLVDFADVVEEVRALDPLYVFLYVSSGVLYLFRVVQMPGRDRRYLS